MRDVDSILESFKWSNFKANKVLGSEAVDRKDVLKVADLEFDLSFIAKEICEVEICSCRGDRALGFGVIRSACIESS